jgi:DNA (cytosine-5)-methyltransferase 1
MLTFGSLFAGIGGFDLGFERAGMRCEWQVEIDPYCSRVLAKHWPNVRRWDDVRTFPPAGEWGVDVICGGFPCIEISSSGTKKGITGKHSGLWVEFARIIRELRPSIVVVENVADIVHRGLGDVLGALALLGCDAEWHVLPAAAFGLPQRRERLFVVAYSDGRGRKGCEKRNGQGALTEGRIDDDGLALAEHRARDAKSWVRRADDGIPCRVDRLRGLGNAVVPQVAEFIGRRILATHAPNRPNQPTQ